MGRPEMVFRIKEWSLKTKTKLRYSEDVYLLSVLQDFLWAWAYFRTFKSDDSEEFLREIHAVLSGDTPNAALFKLCMGYIGPEEEAAKAVRLNPATAIIAASHIEGCPAEVIDPWTAYPIWAYHILTGVKNLSESQKQNCMQALVRSLPWAYEYFTAARLKDTDPEKYDELMRVAIEKWSF